MMSYRRAFLIAITLLTLAVSVAGAQGIPQIAYEIDCGEMQACFGGGNDSPFALINTTPVVSMNHAVAILGLHTDPQETAAFTRYRESHPIDERFIIGDDEASIFGVSVDEFDLLLIGGPEHNAYTREYLDRGVLTYDKTNITGPGMIIESARTASGHMVVVVSSSAGYPADGRVHAGLPPEAAAVLPDSEDRNAAIAIVAGAGLGVLGPYLIVFFSRTFEFVYGFLSTYAGEVASEKESEIRHVHPHQPKKVVFLGYSWLELFMAVSCLVLFGVAFVIADGLEMQPENIIFYIVVGGFVIVAHELGHRLVAYRLKVSAEFKFWGLGSITMLLTSWLFGLVFAQPGRVVIEKEQHTPEEMAAVMLAGPATSLALSIIFLLMAPLGGPAGSIGLLGFSMNMVTVVYSLMPFDPMDGKNIFAWNKTYWAVLFVPITALFVVATYIVV